ncbi:hypothetical protein Bbelb_172160 [Branchiostoma belcheri]|nr:hypothetical protein Bbelb_172160 [Branchiostoma belcheri]
MNNKDIGSQATKGITPPPKKHKYKKKGPMEDAAKETKWNCNTCTEILDDEEGCQALTCDGCEKHFCLACTAFTQQEFKALQKLQRDDVCWFCNVCNKAVRKTRVGKQDKEDSPNKDNQAILETILKRLDTIESKIKTNEESNNEMTKKLDAVQEQTNKIATDVPESTTRHLTKWSSLFDTNMVEDRNTGSSQAQVAHIVKKAMVEQKLEEQERESREQNLIIHRLPESTSTETAQRKSHDKTQVERLFAEPLELGKIEIKSTIRLGKKREDNTPRPLKVVLQNREDKRKIMTRLARLKGANQPFASISIGEDLTKEERELVKKKVQEAKDLEKNEEQEGLWKYRVRGPPWNLQIKKIRVEQAQ